MNFNKIVMQSENYVVNELYYAQKIVVKNLIKFPELMFPCFECRCDLLKIIIALSGDDMMSNNDGKLKEKYSIRFLAMQ